MTVLPAPLAKMSISAEMPCVVTFSEDVLEQPEAATKHNINSDLHEEFMTPKLAWRRISDNRHGHLCELHQPVDNQSIHVIGSLLLRPVAAGLEHLDRQVRHPGTHRFDLLGCDHYVVRRADE
jgi:hypothetical protein